MTFIVTTGFSFASHPEDASPYAYFVATIIGLIFLIKAAPQKTFWPYFIIFGITILLLLDGSAYGTEVFDWEPIYWERHNYLIYDLHNFLSALAVIVRIELENAKWDFAMFAGFWQTNQIILSILVLYVSSLRIFTPKKSEEERRSFSFNLAIIIFILFAIGVIYQLFVLPKDPKNIWIFGLSKNRFLLVGAVLVFIVSQIVIYFNVRESKARIIGFITESMSNSRRKGWVRFVLGLAVLAFIAYQIIIPFRPFPDYKALFPRISPIVFLGAMGLGLMILFLIDWDGIFSRSIKTYWKMFVNFLDRYPAYIYLGFAILQILIAQLVDRHIIYVDKIIPFQDWPGIQTWSVWVEEAFEMVAAFELMLAGLTFYYNRISVDENFQKTTTRNKAV